MKLILRPTSEHDDWKQFLAEPEKHWKPGYSAHFHGPLPTFAIKLPHRTTSAILLAHRLRNQHEVPALASGWSRHATAPSLAGV